jgi:hypothetical protein
MPRAQARALSRADARAPSRARDGVILLRVGEIPRRAGPALE